MQEEIRLKVGASAEDREPLECPVDECGDSLGRITRVEVMRDAPEIDDSASIGFECSRGHKWYMSFDERGGELAYTVRIIRQWAPLPE
jgi:hypothetical protein